MASREENFEASRDLSPTITGATPIEALPACVEGSIIDAQHRERTMLRVRGDLMELAVHVLTSAPFLAFNPLHRGGVEKAYLAVHDNLPTIYLAALAQASGEG